jgi:hypothetical protein
MRDFERRRHLLDFNPWWQNPGGWEQHDPDLREARLNALGAYDPRPLSDIQPGALYLLMGPRRAGKSVAMKRAVARTEHLALLDEAALLVQRNPDTGSEIDFVGPLLQTPIESKYVSQKWRGRRRMLEEHHGRGILATRDILDVSGNIWAIPAGLLAWTIDG